jgi:predicted LPLAT superfamily acyltransferase
LSQHLVQYHKLSGYIDSKAKVFHYANDYGQLDVLLALQEPQRKIVSFIQHEEKRAVAKTNYILKKRNIQYIENIAQTSQNNYDVVLVSDENIGNVEEVTKLADCIILINNARLKDSIINFGFKVDGEEDQLIILRKDVG